MQGTAIQSQPLFDSAELRDVRRCNKVSSDFSEKREMVKLFMRLDNTSAVPVWNVPISESGESYTAGL